MARFYYQNRLVFKVYLHEIQDNFDSNLKEIKEFLTNELGINTNLLEMQLDETIKASYALDI
jgi:hypothetical protein